VLVPRQQYDRGGLGKMAHRRSAPSPSETKAEFQDQDANDQYLSRLNFKISGEDLWSSSWPVRVSNFTLTST